LAESRGTLARRGEHAFLDRLCDRLRAADREAGSARGIVVGPGDDAAVVEPGRRPLAVTTDALVEGVHFRPGWLRPEELGARAIAVNLSDLAAMGASPRWTLVAAIVPPDFSTSDLDRILDACATASEEAGAAMIGGNLSRGDALSLTVTAVGAVEERALERRGARPGDRLVVTGTLGAAAAAVDVWLDGGEPPPALRERFARPVARLAAGRALAAAGARAAIDVSDGLLADLGHVARASGVDIDVDPDAFEVAEPLTAVASAYGTQPLRWVLAGGDDHALAATFPDDAVLPEGFVVVGRVGAATEDPVVTVAGAPWTLDAGHDHFR